MGIVLSGAGSDGTSGIKNLKEQGALVIVQDPSTSKFDGMPYSAVHTGLADFVLSCADIPAQLINYIHNPIICDKDFSIDEQLQSDSDLISQVFLLLQRECGIDFSLYKHSTIARRLERRMGINQISSLKDYLKMLFDQPKELQILSKELLIGVTRFFRDDPAFEQLQQLISKLVSEQGNTHDALRIWDIGCSTGEEAYSVAILIHEVLAKSQIQREVKIFATDVDSDALAEASLGRYPMGIEQDVNQARLVRYFTKEGDTYCIKREIREMVIFANHNIFNDPPFSNVHLVVCRNVLIYLQQSMQKKVIASIHFALHPNSLLFLGPSESLGELQAHFEVIDQRNKIFRKLPAADVPKGALLPSRAFETTRHKGMASVNAIIRSQRESRISPPNCIKDLLIERYVPPCIVVSEQYNALHVYGDVSQFVKKMPPGKVTTNLKELIVEDLSVALTTAMSRAKMEKGEVCYTDLIVKNQQQESVIDLLVRYVEESPLPTAPAYFLVLFESLHRAATAEERKESSFNVNDQSRQRIDDLERELKKEHDNLQVTVEELETTNEELQIINEELMAANEELQSTNEEMQSVNEELFTVNSEYQEKITKLMEVNDDLDNVIESTKLGIIFLDRNLLIRKFTPFVCRFFNLIPSDIGRPFHHISHQLDYDDLIKDIANVSTTAKVIEKEVASKVEADVRLLMKIAPYHTEQLDINRDIVITFTDITQRGTENSSAKK